MEPVIVIFVSIFVAMFILKAIITSSERPRPAMPKDLRADAKIVSFDQKYSPAKGKIETTVSFSDGFVFISYNCTREGRRVYTNPSINNAIRNQAIAEHSKQYRLANSLKEEKKEKKPRESYREKRERELAEIQENIRLKQKEELLHKCHYRAFSSFESSVRMHYFTWARGELSYDFYYEFVCQKGRNIRILFENTFSKLPEDFQKEHSGLCDAFEFTEKHYPDGITIAHLSFPPYAMEYTEHEENMPACAFAFTGSEGTKDNSYMFYIELYPGRPAAIYHYDLNSRQIETNVGEAPLNAEDTIALIHDYILTKITPPTPKTKFSKNISFPSSPTSVPSAENTHYKRIPGSSPDEYSEIYFLDENNNFAAEEQAKKAVIREMKNGVLVRETWGHFQ